MPAAEIEVISPAFKNIIRAESQVEEVAEGLQFCEGPIWVQEGGYLLFSDIPANRIMRWSSQEGLSVWRELSGNANGHTLDLQGRLVSCEHGNRRVSRTEPDGTVVTLADTYQGKRLNSPNDVVVKSDGTIWFTDPPYGIDPQVPEQPRQYVFRLDPETRSLTPVAEDFERPNGLCFSVDERRLYIADSSRRHHIRVFDVQRDGTLSGGQLFVAIDPGAPDGMKVDSEDRLYSTAGDGVHVFSPEGELLGKIKVPETPANCAFGGPEGSTLYMTARTSLYAVNLAATGAGRP